LIGVLDDQIFSVFSTYKVLSDLSDINVGGINGLTLFSEILDDNWCEFFTDIVESRTVGIDNMFLGITFDVVDLGFVVRSDSN